MDRIVRPVVSIVRFGDGRSTYSVSSPGWNNEYQRRVSSGDLGATKKHAKTFGEHFDELAGKIENGTDRPYGIMRMFVQRGLFNSVRKLSIDPTLI